MKMDWVDDICDGELKKAGGRVPIKELWILFILDSGFWILTI